MQTDRARYFEVSIDRYGGTSLVRREATVTSSPVATTISTASGSKATSSAIKASPKTSSPTSATPTHAGYIGAFWGDLDISAFENAVIEDESLRNETGFGKLDVGVPVIPSLAAAGHRGGA